MPRTDEPSPYLLAHLRALMSEYGPRTVYDAAAVLINELTPPDAGNGHNGPPDYAPVPIPDPAPSEPMTITSEDDWDKWRRDNGAADPANVGPMGNR